MNADEIKQKAEKAEAIVAETTSKLKDIKKREIEAIYAFNSKKDGRKIDKIKKEIEGL